MTADVLLLSRLQFAANISFHILFPTITIALGWYLLYFRVRHVLTRAPTWEQTCYFWTKVFALSFALGVVSGIVMSFQFGTNWPGFMQRAGDIAGPLLGYEVLTAFFLEASFLGIMLFGRERVPPAMHLAATFFVAAGTTLSAFWILSLNSWMQTPTGYEVVDGRLLPVDWFAIVFNPSFPYRFAHVLLASFLTASFLILGLSAWQVLKRVDTIGTHHALRAALAVVAVAAPLQIFVGDLHGLNTLEHQPAKIAAIEGIWERQRGAPLALFGLPDEATGSTRYALEIPRLASLILTHDLDGELAGIADFPGAHPPVAPVFYAFRVMVGVGSLMLLAAVLGAWQAWRQRGNARLALPQPFLWLLAGMSFSGWLATLAGWYVTEIGRQPFIVYGQLRIADVVTTLPARYVGFTLAAYVVVYGLLLITYVGVLKYMAEHPAQRPTGAATGAELGKAGV